MNYGLIGLGKMGANLALNISKKKNINVYNRTTSKTYKVCDQNRERIHGFDCVESFINETETPRKIITMLPNGIEFDFLRHMDPGDTIIDCANERWDVSQQKEEICNRNGVNYLGVGMSGGYLGALHGPAVMIGGSLEAYRDTRDFFESFCNSSVFIGKDPDLGHFTKMVHNGIEYGMLQAIADVYSYANHERGIMYEILEGMGDGYLIGSARKVCADYDVDNIVDRCEMNDTGLWCSQWALDKKIPLTVINTSVACRINSTRTKAPNSYKKLSSVTSIKHARGALRFVFAMAFLEGLRLVKSRGIPIPRAQAAWSEHTIIWSDMCKMSPDELQIVLERNIYDIRYVASECALKGISIPVISAALQDYELNHTRHSQMAFVSAQRNDFGNHPICFHNNETS